MNYTSRIKHLFFSSTLSLLWFSMASVATAQEIAEDILPGVRKVQDIVIYQEDGFYTSFPSIAKRNDGELILMN